MDCEFVLPLQSLDLELVTAKESNGYQVRSKIEPNFMAEAKLLSVLGEVVDRLSQDFTAITHQSVFDCLYSITCANKFDVLSGRVKQVVAEALVESVNKFLRQLSSLKFPSSSNHIATRPQRNSVKMHVLLLCALATRAEKAEETSRVLKKPVVSVPKAKGGKELGALMFSLCTTMLENKVNFVAKTKSITDLIYKLFALSVRDYGLIVRASTALMHLLHNFEHVPLPVAALLKLCTEQYNMHRLVASVIQEIGRLEVKFLAKDNTGAKNIALFLEEIASSLPGTVLRYVHVLLPHLDGESYLIRNGVVRLLGQVIEKAFANDISASSSSSSSSRDSSSKKKQNKKKDQHEGEGEDEEEQEEVHSDKENEGAGNVQDKDSDDEEDLDESRGKESLKKSRDELFDILLERANDVTSFTRSKVLQQFQHLTEAKCIPLARVSQVAHLALDRLQDKAVQVRKNAIQLLIAMLEYNNFGASLSLDPFASRARAGAEQLKAKLLAKQQQQQQTAGKLIWEKDTEEEGESLVSDKAAIAQDEAENAQLLKEREALDMHFEAVKFIEVFNIASPILCQLLNSKTSSDILECVRFFVVAHEFQIDSAPIGIRKMLVLIWSKEPPVVEAVMEAYRRLYIGNCDFTLVREIQSGLALSIARNFIRLPTGASMSYLTSLEELLSKMTKSNLMPLPVISALWDVFSNAAGNDESSRLNSLTLLSMLSSSSMIVERLPVLVSVGLGPRASLPLKRITCVALQKIASEDVKDIKDKTRERLLQILVVLLTTTHSGVGAREWYGAASEALNAVFILSDKPERESKEVLTSLLKQAIRKPNKSSSSSNSSRNNSQNESDNEREDVKVKEEEEATARGEGENRVGNAELLSRLFFVVGHVSVKMLVYLESMEAKARKARIQMRVDKKQLQEEEEAQATKKNKKKVVKDKEKKDKEADNIEDELAVGASEEYEMEQLREEAEQQMVKGKDSLLGPFGPVVVAVCSQPQTYQHVSLQQSAVLALCKLMCISAEFCETHLRLLFTILTKSKDATSRSNILVALGDMSFRFPNLIEPWAPYMYACLNDTSVRKHALMVLTHLILNDMQKAKRPVADIAKCLVDSDPRISNLAKMFFNELALKGKNPVYNLLPDIISRLSNDENVNSESFRVILRFLITFIQKDKQTESLVEKLCHRFNQMDMDTVIVQSVTEAEGEEMALIAAPEDIKLKEEPQEGSLSESHAAVLLKQCRDVAYCLAQLSFSSPGAIKKLTDCFRFYGPKLGDKDIYESFTSIIGKAKKNVGIKPEQKQQLDDLLAKFSEVHDKAVEDQQAHYKANTARGKNAHKERRPESSDTEMNVSAVSGKNKASAASKRREKAAVAASKRPARRGKQASETELSEDEETSFDDQESVDSEIEASKYVSKKTATKTQSGTRRQVSLAKNSQSSDAEDLVKQDIPTKRNSVRKAKSKLSSDEDDSERSSEESESSRESADGSQTEEEKKKLPSKRANKKKTHHQ